MEGPAASDRIAAAESAASSSPQSSSDRVFRADVVAYPGLVLRIGIYLPAVILLAIFGAQLAAGGNVSAGLVYLAALLGVFGWRFSKRLLKDVSIKRKQPRERHHSVTVKGGNLISRGDKARVLIKKEDIAHGFVLPDQNVLGHELGARVIIDGRFTRLMEVWLRSKEEARELLVDLGLSPLERPMTFSFFFGMRVTVGVDGVLVAWPLLRKRRFIRHDQIDDVRWSGDRVRLLLKDGKEYTITTNASGRLSSVEPHQALVERLLVARDEWRARAGGEEQPTNALLRSGRSLEGWVKDLRSLSDNAAAGSQYRNASIPNEVLWRVALDPAEQEELRIGASLALRSSLDAEGKDRLRDAATAAASPRVRVALQAAADEPDDDSVAEAMRLRKRE
jgi:hypothetical protein